MRPIEVTLLILMIALTRAQLEEWQLNREDAIVLAERGVPTVSLWQCGTLKQRIADLSQHSARCSFNIEGKTSRM
ncbi:MAG: hypothetical protein ACRDCY_16225 [Aeromonas veronii]